jgi:hypothetical protein
MYPFRALETAGARIAGSSDWFFTDERPGSRSRRASPRAMPGVADSAPMHPDHTLSRETLLHARTLGGAYQLFAEDLLGSLTLGKQAGFVVLDRAVSEVPAARLHETRVLRTFIAGREVASAR